MEKIIYLKYGELTLKGKNRDDFSSLAFKNLKNALKEYDLNLKKNYDNVVISNLKESNLDEVIDIAQKVPGFTNLAIAYVVEKEMDVLIQSINELLPSVNGTTFKVAARRKDKKFKLNSDEINRQVASFILQNNEQYKVDIHHPDFKINIEVNDKIIFYFNKIPCANGLPIGSSGRVLMLLSGGIDSVVASHLLMKRGLHVDFITFITPPHTSPEALQKVRDLARIVSCNQKLENFKLYVCNFTKVQDELTHIDKESYRITLLRRSFLRIATKVAQQYNYDALATGESLGQVASQTIDSMNVISSATSALILRPLLTYDKNEIIKVAESIGTYDTSILPYCDSCTLFAPKNPVTKPKLEIALELENKLDLLSSIEELVYNNIEKESNNDY